MSMKKSYKPPIKILLVEDEPIVMMVNQMFLKEIGYEPDVAETGKKALSLASNHYDFIFTDIGLPDIDGISVAAAIRESEKKNNVAKPAKIIALTAYKISDVLEKCLAVGIDDVLNKPVSVEKLRAVIQKFN